MRSLHTVWSKGFKWKQHLVLGFGYSNTSTSPVIQYKVCICVPTALKHNDGWSRLSHTLDVAVGLRVMLCAISSLLIFFRAVQSVSILAESWFAQWHSRAWTGLSSCLKLAMCSSLYPSNPARLHQSDSSLAPDSSPSQVRFSSFSTSSRVCMGMERDEPPSILTTVCGGPCPSCRLWLSTEIPLSLWSFSPSGDGVWLGFALHALLLAPCLFCLQLFHRLKMMKATRPSSTAASMEV